MDYLGELRHFHSNSLEHLENLLEKQELNEAEFTTLCLIPFLLKSGPNPFQPRLLFPSSSERRGPVSQFLFRYAWRGHSDRIRRALYRWSCGRYPLLRWKTIPTPLELLEVQAQGRRGVTVFSNPQEWEQNHQNKSAFEFVIHDLVHADHFFEKDDWQEGQQVFYQFILSRWNEPLIQAIRQLCPNSFDYLISDMNSHPLHLMRTLHALSLETRKKELGLDLKTRLPESEEKRWCEDLEKLGKPAMSYLIDHSPLDCKVQERLLLKDLV
jgi:hypothetical protein